VIAALEGQAVDLARAEGGLLSERLHPAGTNVMDAGAAASAATIRSHPP
jgi:hypothetical protein